MMRPSYQIKALLALPPGEQTHRVYGWVRTFRNEKFISLVDGSSLSPLQVVVDEQTQLDATQRTHLQTGTSLCVEGVLVASPAQGQRVELKATKIEVLGKCNPEQYPLQPKKHSLAFLREMLHWRPRTQVFHAVFKIRNELAFATHQFFREQNFVYWHTPILTASDCEGAGEMFRVTNFDLNHLPKTEEGRIDDSQDFFGKAAHLTVSGQLEGELGMMSFGQIYTFAPTFRAENSNTTRHLAEFWMIEPEMAFYDLEDNAHLAQDFVVHLVKAALKNCSEELAFLDQFHHQEQQQLPAHERKSKRLLETLEMIVREPFVRITYTEAIQILQSSPHYAKKKFTYPVEWGLDLQSEHERYLVEKHFNAPVVVTNYPASIKAFYMRMNEDGRTVAAMDILFPGIGEIVGGSQREERLEVLEQRMKAMQIDYKELEWYLDTRRFGTVPHSGFGLGFERMIQFVTGMNNIRDVIPFPRYPRGIQF